MSLQDHRASFWPPPGLALPGVSEQQRWNRTAGCGQGCLGLCHKVCVEHCKRVEVGGELVVSCSQSEDGDLCCAVQMVGTGLICPCVEKNLPYCAEFVSQDGLGFAVG